MGKLIKWNEWRSGKRVIEEAPLAKEVAEKIPAVVVEEASADIQMINEAEASDLSKIKGVGPKTIKKILENRPFTDFDDMDKRGEIPSRSRGSLRTWAEN